VSSAILYLAIVAIWAFMLVPRWVRRSHTASLAGGSSPAEVTPEEPERPGADRFDGNAEFAGDAGPASDEAEADTAPLPVVTVPPRHTSSPSAAEAHGGAQAAPAARIGPAGPPESPRPALGRTKVLQARRRLLTILALLAIAAVSCTVLRLTSPWVCIPPAVMLGMYVLLLRETALADAEQAHHQAQQAAAARARAEARSREAWAARTPQPTAQVIDISGRLADQLYDQYDDATIRAVGD
jgi:hypothetical protein